MISDEELKKRLLAPLEGEKRQASTNGIKNQNGQIVTESIASYISNPTGRGSAYVASRAMIKQGLNITFVKLLQKYRRHFYALPYTYPNGDILFLVKVPSEEYEHNKITYDVMFLIKYDRNKTRENRDIEVYSNCPSFVFTYCYVYNKKGLFLTKLRDKMPREALENPPVIRNPIESLGFEKSTYIAARYLIDGHCLSDSYVAKFSKIMDQQTEAKLFAQVADPETIVAVYQHAQYQYRKTHRKELAANEKKRRDDANKEYAREQKKIEPRGGFIFHKSPRSKITARKAKRSLMNEKKDNKK